MSPVRCKNLPVAHPDQKHVRKEILGNVVQPSQADALQSHGMEFIIKIHKPAINRERGHQQMRILF